MKKKLTDTGAELGVYRVVFYDKTPPPMLVTGTDCGSVALALKQKGYDVCSVGALVIPNVKDVAAL